MGRFRVSLASKSRMRIPRPRERQFHRASCGRRRHCPCPSDLESDSGPGSSPSSLAWRGPDGGEAPADLSVEIPESELILRNNPCNVSAVAIESYAQISLRYAMDTLPGCRLARWSLLRMGWRCLGGEACSRIQHQDRPLRRQESR